MFADEEARTRDLWQRADMLLRNFAILTAGVAWLVAQTTARMTAALFSFVPVLLAGLGVLALTNVAWQLARVLGRPAVRDTPSDPKKMLQHHDEVLARYSQPVDESVPRGDATEVAHRAAIAECRQHYGRQYFHAAAKNRGVNDGQAAHLLSGRYFLVWAALLAALSFAVDQLQRRMSGST